MLDLLIISVSSGAGHVRAGEALVNTAKQIFPDKNIRHIDLMDYVRTAVKGLIRSYDVLVKETPRLYGALYNHLDDPKIINRFRLLSRVANRVNAAELYEYIQIERPAQVLCTHFLPAHAMLAMPAKSGVTVPVSLVLTDYDRHAFLTVPGLAYYFVATEKMKWKMERQGIGRDQIVVSGIPIEPAFYQKKSVEELQARYRIPREKKMVLVLAGGKGLARTDRLITEIFSLDLPLILVTIAGKNKQLERRLRALQPRRGGAPMELRVVGWTDTMDEYQRLADVIITKPGGLTTTECIALGKPIIAVNPIPGQEEQNARYILEQGYGVEAMNTEDLLYYLTRPPAELAPGFERIKKMPPSGRAAETILRTIFGV